MVVHEAALTSFLMQGWGGEHHEQNEKCAFKENLWQHH